MALSLLSAAPSFADSDENEPDIIRIASLFRTLTLDPTRTVYTGSIEAFGQMYSSLFRRDRDGALQPALAESWEISEDGLEYIFQMREARFSDGSPITAEDAAFTLLRMRDDPEAAYKAPVMEIVDAWAEDARTLRVRFNKPNAAFLESVEMCFLGIVSKRDVEARGNDGAFADIQYTRCHAACWRDRCRSSVESRFCRRTGE
jgi:peptide/nickel transport system substrate-binding protein